MKAMTQPKLRVYWFPQVPCDMFCRQVGNLVEAKLLLEVLADYDQFQYDHRIKPDYCNAGGLQEWYEEDQEWVEWTDEDTGRKIDDYTLDELRELQ